MDAGAIEVTILFTLPAITIGTGKKIGITSSPPALMMLCMLDMISLEIPYAKTCYEEYDGTELLERRVSAGSK
jgi:hypothetical protein